METKNKTVNIVNRYGPIGWIGCTAYLGALVYFGQHAGSFVGFLLGLLKAAVWPAYLIYHLLEVLKV